MNDKKGPSHRDPTTGEPLTTTEAAPVRPRRPPAEAAGAAPLLDIYQRLQLAREEVTYIRKSALPSGAPYKSAVAHEALIEKVRPILVKLGILWYPVAVERLDGWHGIVPTKSGERFMHFVQVRTTVRFVCAECEPDCPATWLEVQVITDGWDDADKGGPKAMTYADKAALLSILNLQRGDDPDFDHTMDLGADDETAKRIKLLNTLVEERRAKLGDPEAYIRGTLVQVARSKGRYRVPTLYHLSHDELDKWVAKLQKEVPADTEVSNAGSPASHHPG